KVRDVLLKFSILFPTASGSINPLNLYFPFHLFLAAFLSLLALLSALSSAFHFFLKALRNFIYFFAIFFFSSPFFPLISFLKSLVNFFHSSLLLFFFSAAIFFLSSMAFAFSGGKVAKISLNSVSASFL